MVVGRNRGERRDVSDNHLRRLSALMLASCPLPPNFAATPCKSGGRASMRSCRSGLCRSGSASKGNRSIGNDAIPLGLRSAASPSSGPARRGPAWPKPSKRRSGRNSWRKSSLPAGSMCRPTCAADWPAAAGSECRRIHLHAARPAGVNEPTPEGVAGSMEILRLVESLGPDDLCLCLISGGGSALMPAPVEGITLADKLAVTRHLERGRREHRATQHGAKAAQPHQGRRPAAGVPRRAIGFADHLRRARRPAGHHRVRPDRARRLDAASRVGGARTIRRARSRHRPGGVRVFGASGKCVRQATV